VHGLTVAAEPFAPREVSGTVALADGSIPGPLTVTLVGTFPGSHVRTSRNTSGKSAADGTFVLKGLVPGHYDLAARSDFPVLSARLGGLDVRQSGFDVGAGDAGPLRIVLSRTSATVSGRVVNRAGQPAAYAAILFVSTDGDPTTFALSQPSGEFRETLLPGDYHVYALPDLNEPGTFESPAYLRAHADDLPILHAGAGAVSLALKLP
jgi:hypothetical protein